MPRTRTYVPCRVCGQAHTNPRSSSICPDCGRNQAENGRIAREEEAFQEAREKQDRVIAFYEMRERGDLKEMIEFLMDHYQEHHL